MKPYTSRKYKTRVSLVMGVLNPKLPELELALSSALGAFDEIIVVDDGSTIPLVPIPGVKLIRHEKNMGFWAARNTAVKAAKNEWISTLDCDDYFNPNDLDQLYRFADENTDSADIIHFPVKLFGDENGTWAVCPDVSVEAFREGNRIPSGSWFRKSIWEKLGGYKPVLGAEDWDFWAKAAATGFRFVYLNRFIYSHQVRKGSETDKYRSTYEQLKQQVLTNLKAYEQTLAKQTA